MATQTALIAHTPGALSESAVPTPTLKAGEVLVKVSHTSFVPLEVEIVDKGLLQEQFYPFVPGLNLAGVVTQVDAGVPEGLVGVGDRVRWRSRRSM